MESLKAIHARAAKRHGGAKALDAMLPRPKAKAALRRAKDDRLLSELAKTLFQMGFVWRVVEAKWPGFEEAFEGFDPGAIAGWNAKQLGKLRLDTRIIRNPQKIQAVHENARFFVDLQEEHGSVGRYLAAWPEDDVVGLWEDLKARGTRLGGMTAPMWLRRVGRDTFMLSNDGVQALREQGAVVTKSPSSKKALAAIQDAFDQWREESGRSYAEISRILSCSTGQIYDGPMGEPEA